MRWTRLVDADGIVCLPAVAGEQSAAERVRAVLAASFGDWSSSKLDELLVAGGGKPGTWPAGWRRRSSRITARCSGTVRSCGTSGMGYKDGFSALVNYHRLDRATLERLTYRDFGLVDRPAEGGRRVGCSGADARLNAAQVLQAKLQLILEGEPPYDIYVRWKELAEQPLGWDPDLDDGVRLNIRPFVEAGVLRSKFHDPLEEGPGHEPRRLRTPQRPAPHPRREAQSKGTLVTATVPSGRVVEAVVRQFERVRPLQP